MKQMKDFIDKWGLLDKHYNPDGGDTCHREGMYFSLLAMTKRTKTMKKHDAIRYDVVMKKLHVAPGVFVRHSNPDYDASDWDRMSRDQFQPMIIAAGFYDKKQLKNITIGHLKRGFLFTNNTRKNGANKRNHGKFVAGEIRDYRWKLPDLTGPEIWSNFIRSWDCMLLWPLLCVLDIEILIGALRWRFFPKHNIAMNHTLSLLQAKKRLPTPLTWFAGKIMPVPRLAKLIGEHFRDFPDDMVFFEQMFLDANK